MISKKRLFLAAGTIASVGAVVALAVGITFGLFSASQTSAGSSFAAGTVALPAGDVVDTTCLVSDIVPGDQTAAYSPANPDQTNAAMQQCSFTVKYTGSVPAFIGLKLSTTGTGLYSGGNDDGLEFQISDGTNSYTTDGSINSPGDELYVATDPGTSNAGGDTYTFTVDYALPALADNTYQGLNTTLNMQVEAVQAGNNGSATGCNAGDPCLGISNWS